ncbi:MAG: trypsin-like peptidase domain-containing protein, partial [Acidobacteriota bacterium]
MKLGTWKNSLRRRIVVFSLAATVLAGAGAWELARPIAADAAAAPMAAPAPAPPAENSTLLALDQATEALAARVTPAVVNITVTSKRGAAEGGGGQNQPQGQPFFGPDSPFGQFFGQPMQQGPEIERVLGSGVIISPNGYIVTNNHVIKGAMNIRVTMSNREVYPAKLIGADPLTDLAVIKIDGHNLP